ncbi:MAG: hypothetical protein EAZ99_08515 [Alphaproteobacteria bacterium]|nr:MAG: hypothetical protein EAZ99_08515 [Alphaproteobacteria bacterium]
MNSLSAGVVFAAIFAASFLALAYFLDPRVDFFGTFIASWILIVGMMILILVAAAHAIVPLFVLAFYGFSAYLMIEDGIVPEWEAALIILDILPGMPKIIGIIISIISVGWAILSFAMDREWIDL